MVQIGGIQKFSTVDYPGYAVAAIFTIGCNMRCGYCHNPELVLPEQYVGTIPEHEILEFLASRKGLLDGVAISGGEPTMQADLPAFIRAIKAMGFLVKLDTNGTNPAMLKELLDEKLIDFVAMDIKGPLEKYSQIAARPINLQAIRQSIALIKTIDHEFRTTIVAGQLTPADFESIGQLVQGSKRYALQYFVPSGALVSPQFQHMQALPEQDMETIRQTMLGYVKECVVH